MRRALVLACVACVACVACAACAAPAPAGVAVPQAPAATGFSRGDRLRVQLDEDEIATDAADPRKRQMFPSRDVTAVVITSSEPLAIALVVDKRVPDPDHAVGISCGAPAPRVTRSPGAASNAAPGADGGACVLATRRLNALVDLEAGLVGRVPLDLIGAAPTDVHTTATAQLEHDRTEFVVTADGTRAGRAIHLKGHVTADRGRTRLVAHLEGTDGDRSLEVFVDLGPAD